MGTISNILNFLAVENELLVKIINIPFTFIELYLAMLIFTYILKIKYTKKQCFFYILSLSIIGILTIFLIPKPYNTFVNIIMLPVFVYIFFKTNILAAVLSEIIQYAVFLLMSVSLETLYTKTLNITLYKLINTPIHQLMYSSILYSSVFIFYLILKHIYSHNLKTIKEKKDALTLLINFIIGIIAIAVDSLILTKYSNILPIRLIFINIFVIITYFIISMYSLYRTGSLEETTMNLEEQKLYNKTLTILYDNVRGFKHDFNNIVQSIGGYIDSDNLEGLKKYYKELLKDCQIVNNLTILNPEIINNPAIYSLLTSKYHRGEELGIKFNLEAFLDLNSLDVNIYKFSKILGILLDNAIEACSTSFEKTINITIRRDPRVKRSLFIIENTYSNKDVDTDKIFEKGYTSKSDSDSKNHGIGLWEVRKYIKRARNLNLFTTKNNMFFKQQLEIYDEKL